MRRLFFVISLSLLLVGCSPVTQTPLADPATATIVESTPLPTIDIYFKARQSMVRDQIELRGIKESDVLQAMRSVERHSFVPQDYLDQAYDDHPLPIGYGQTISQPYIVALMTRELGVEPGDRVLEIGTGSGYQAAVLAEMGVEVFTVEIIPELATGAEARLHDLGYDRVHVLNADGYFGWEEYAPYDAIIVTAAPDHMPQSLANQLADGGRLIIPIGPVGLVQTLWKFEKIDSELQAENLGGVRFVPFTRSLQQ